MATIESLGTMAAEIAMKAFADFIRGRSIKLDDAKIDEAIVVLRRIVKEDVVAALDDAKEAFACRMDAIGVATFKASIMQSGIKAAREVTGAA